MFDMRVIAWSQNLTDARAREVGVERVDKDRLLGESDFVTLHVVLSDRTQGLIGAADMAKMKPTAYLVNTSRGPVVDEDALVDALGVVVVRAMPPPVAEPVVLLELVDDVLTGSLTNFSLSI